MTIDWNDFLSLEARLREDSAMTMSRSDDIISLALGLPAPSCFPLKGIKLQVESPSSDFSKTETIERTIEEHPDEFIPSCQYVSSNGLKTFNDWIANYVETYFKPDYNNWDFIIQAGATHSLDAIFRLLINPGEDTVLCETLTYSCFLETCIPFRVNLLSIEMDEFGVIPSKIDELLLNWDIDEKTKNMKRPKVFYTMPTGHNPTGITLSTERRMELLRVANKHNFIIIEDDPYYHLQLDNNPQHIPSLLKFDTEGRVIRIDSFSKMLMPGLRVSIVSCNKVFQKKLAMHNELSIHSASANSQLILQMIFNQWGNDGFQKWLSHLQSMYIKRRDILLGAFDKYLPQDLVTYNRPTYGMFIWINANLNKFVKPSDLKLSDYEWVTFIEEEIFKVASEKYKTYLLKGHLFMKDKVSTTAGFRATYSYASEDNMIRGSEYFGKAIQEVYDNLYKK